MTGVQTCALPIYTHPLNVASIKTLLNAGFEKEAVLKKHMTRRDGVQDDALMFSKWDESEVVR